MKGIISINKKFMIFSPNELIKIILNNSKYAQGIEISIDSDNNNEIDYLKKLATLCKENNLYFEVHGNSSLTLIKQKRYINLLENISDELGYPINVCMHPLVGNNKNESINKTIIYMNEVIKFTDFNKITISLENLNDYNKEDRLDKNEIKNIVLNNEKLFMTYDIGHDLIENGNLLKMDKYLINKISNLHIHTYDEIYSDGFDHKPIFKNDPHFNKLMKTLIFLKLNNYLGTLVFEYDLYSCPGENIKEKLIAYLKSIDYVCERI